MDQKNSRNHVPKSHPGKFRGITVFLLLLTVRILAGEDLEEVMNRALKESDPREKIALYDRIIETHPDLASAYYNRGLVFMEQHAWQEARLDFKKYVSLKPREPSGYNNLAVSSYHLEDYENARLYWDEALRRDPGNLSYFRNKITAMIQDENYKEAIPLLKRKTGASFPDGWILMADIYRRLGVGEQELDNLARYLEIDQHA